MASTESCSATLTFSKHKCYGKLNQCTFELNYCNFSNVKYRNKQSVMQQVETFFKENVQIKFFRKFRNSNLLLIML